MQRENINRESESYTYSISDEPGDQPYALAGGIDKMLLRIDAMGREVNMRSIRRFGEEVIPEVKRQRAKAA